jgi:large subunit ribosomal protein L32e
MTKKKPKFLRTNVNQYSKLGVRRKKKQKYRKSKGRDNKIRLKMKGHLRNVAVGFRSARAKRGLITGLKPVLIHNVKELLKIKEGEIGIIARIGDKKRMEIAKIALEKNIKLENLNAKKFLKEIEFKLKKKKEEKDKKEVKKVKSKKELEKKAKEKKEAEKKEKEKADGDDKKEEGEKVGDAEKKTEVKTKETKSKSNKDSGLSNNYGRGK